MIARALGKSLGELRLTVSTLEFAQWIALYNVEAFERKQAEKKGR